MTETELFQYAFLDIFATFVIFGMAVLLAFSIIGSIALFYFRLVREMTSAGGSNIGSAG